MSTSITGQGISIYPAPDDALSSTSKNPVQNKVIDEEITDVKNAISQLEFLSDIENSVSYAAVANMFDSGSFNNTGTEVSASTAIRSRIYYHCLANNIETVTCDEGYKIGIRAWLYGANSQTYVGFLKEDGTFGTSGTQFTPTTFDLSKYPNLYFRFVLYRNDNTNISVSEATHFRFCEYVVGLNQTQNGLVRTNETGLKDIKYYIGSFVPNRAGLDMKDDGNRIMVNYVPPTRAFTEFIHLDAGSVFSVSSTDYKFFALYFQGEPYYCSNAQWMPSLNFQTNTIRFITHADAYVAVRFARVDDDTLPIDLNDLKAKVNIVVSTEATKAEARLIGQKISIMGDSISSYSGYVPSGALSYYPAGDVTHVSRMYWEYLARMTGMVVDTVNAYAGTTVGTKWQTTERIPFTDESRLSNLGNPDYIIVFGGVNDYGGNPLGDYPIDGVYTNMYEFRTAYAYLLSQLKQRYPSARIICLTILDASGYSVSGVYPLKQKEVVQALAPDKTTHYLYEFNDSIIELAKRYNCAVCDISDCMNHYNSSDSIDGTHPQMVVHERIAYKLREALLDM